MYLYKLKLNLYNGKLVNYINEFRIILELIS